MTDLRVKPATGWRKSRIVPALVAPVRGIGRLVKRLFVTPPTASEAREADQQRQREVRRDLRGLEHEPDRPAKAE